MDNDNVILRNEPADYVAHNVLEAILDGVQGDDLLEWHRARLKHLYISKNDKIEIEIVLDRGWDTKMKFDIESNPDESVDRLTDYLYNNVKQVVRDRCREDFDVAFDEMEKIKTLRIRQKTAEYSGVEEPNYMVEFDTMDYDSVIVSDHHMSGNPRICGRRVLVSWIWTKYLRQDMDPEEIAESLDGTVTVSEINSAIDFARNSDEFDDSADIDDDNEKSELVSVEELKAEIDETSFEERLDIEDNR